MISRRDVIVGYVLLTLAALISLGPLIGVVILALGAPGQVGIKLDITSAGRKRAETCCRAMTKKANEANIAAIARLSIL